METTPSIFSRIILGTAQFGLDYGVSNKSGLMTTESANSILEVAATTGITLLDTAQAYGGSENVIGRHINSIFKVQTKVGSFPHDETDLSEWLAQKIASTQEKIGNHKLTTVFFHDPSQLLGDESIRARKAAHDFLNHSSDMTFGASLYDPDDWNSLRNYDEISVYQVPYSIFDRRFLESRVIDEMVEKGKKVQVRSIFLQGLLLMGQKDTPKYFEPWLPQLNEFHDFCEETGFSASGIAAAFVLQNNVFDGVVVGFQSKGELLELASHFSAGLVTLDHFPTFNDLGLEILDPRNWRLS